LVPAICLQEERASLAGYSFRRATSGMQSSRQIWFQTYYKLSLCAVGAYESSNLPERYGLFSCGRSLLRNRTAVWRRIHRLLGAYPRRAGPAVAANALCPGAGEAYDVRARDL